MTSAEIRQLCEKLKEIGPRLIIDRDLTDLLRLREAIGDVDLADVASQPEGLEVIAPLYLIKKLINDVYINFATDASFGFPTDPGNWALNQILNFSSEIGYFITIVFPNPENTESSQEAQSHLFEAIHSYYSLIAKINSKLEFISSIEAAFSEAHKL